MKKVFILVLIAFVLIACNLPFSVNFGQTPTPVVIVETPVVVPTDIIVPTVELTMEPTVAPIVGTEMNLGGIYMIVPPCLAVEVTGSIIPAQPYDANNGPMEYWPLHRALKFGTYPLSDKFFDPVLRVYPVTEYAAMNSFVSDQVSALNALLVSQMPVEGQSIPLLPNFYAAQVFRAKVKFLPVQNGQGVRFLTEYAQYAAPVNNHDLFYTYQGLTADGKYWISAIFPVNAAYLQDQPDSAQVPDGGVPVPLFSSPNWEAEMQTYMTTMLAKLNETANTDFSPSLDCLDQYIQSLQISD